METVNRRTGAMLGLAVGDALGAPMEGLKSGHVRQLHGEIVDYVDSDAVWRKKPRKWRIRGLYGGDAQQALALADALVKCRGFEPTYFAKLLVDLARAETGGDLGAYRGGGRNFYSSVTALMDGSDPSAAGVSSPGMGAMMRAVVCGLYFADDEQALSRAAIEQGLLTHNDPRTLAMAALAARAVGKGVSGAWDGTKPVQRMHELVAAAAEVERLVESEYVHRVPVEAMDRFGLAVKAIELLPRLLDLPEQNMVMKQIVGEANRQFPEHKITEPGQGFVMAAGVVSLFVALAARDFEDAVKQAVNLGKATDAMGAIVGAIVGARLGEDAIPERWREGLVNGKQVALRGEALDARDAGGLGLAEIVSMEMKLTKREVAEREAFRMKMEAKGVLDQPTRKKPKKAAPEPESAPLDEAAKAEVKRTRRQKKKRKREKAPWKQ